MVVARSARKITLTLSQTLTFSKRPAPSGVLSGGKAGKIDPSPDRFGSNDIDVTVRQF
ncbi:MAG: hypothetical protein IPG76_23055 [Acidobacteria bacterium]|nr:hypothetical protein [Acidobacteriota bacterium]